MSMFWLHKYVLMLLYQLNYLERKVDCRQGPNKSKQYYEPHRKGNLFALSGHIMLAEPANSLSRCPYNHAASQKRCCSGNYILKTCVHFTETKEKWREGESPFPAAWRNQPSQVTAGVFGQACHYLFCLTFEVQEYSTVRMIHQTCA